MANRDILAIGTSAGGVDALLFLVRHLGADLPASVLITIHLPPNARSVLDEVLNGAGSLPAKFVRGTETLRKGQIYLAPPDHHLLVDAGRITLGHGPRENNSRPAIDVMLRSAAACCGPRAVGVVLTGTLGDGASGLWAVGRCGGLTVVQDPRDAAFPQMPTNALARVAADHVVPLADMPRLLHSLAHEPAGEPVEVPERIRREVTIAKGGGATMSDMDAMGRRSVLACPDCHGVMWEIDEGDLVRYRCHVGHTYTAEVMSVALDENLRRALDSALRVLEERLSLAERLAAQADEAQRPHLARSWRDKAAEAQAELDTIRRSVREIELAAATSAAAEQ